MKTNELKLTYSAPETRFSRLAIRRSILTSSPSFDGETSGIDDDDDKGFGGSTPGLE